MKIPSERAILALDTAGASCSVALWRGSLIAQQHEEMLRGQSERLLPMIVELLDGVAWSFADLDALAVTRGPGAFTGLRIGLAAVRGLAFARALPVVAVTCFEAVAVAIPQAQRRDRCLAVALESRRQDIYLQTFDLEDRPLSPPAAVSLEDLGSRLSEGRWLLAGDAKRRAAARCAGDRVRLYDGDDRVTAARVAQLAAGRPAEAGGRLEPLYLRPPDVTLPSAQRTDRSSQG